MLPPETEQVWHFLKQQPALAGFVLLGVSALALRIGHRLSEDLDLAGGKVPHDLVQPVRPGQLPPDPGGQLPQELRAELAVDVVVVERP